MLELLIAAVLATGGQYANQTPEEKAHLERIGPHVQTCLRGASEPGELLETCAMRLAVAAEAKAAARAVKEAEVRERFGEPCEAGLFSSAECTNEQLLARRAIDCIDGRFRDETEAACMERIANLDWDDPFADYAPPRPIPTAAPPPPPPPPAREPLCRRETVVRADGATETTLRCGRGDRRQIEAARQALDAVLGPD